MASKPEKTEQVDLILLLDDSGSIGNGDFDKIRRASQQIILSHPNSKDVMFGCVMFHNNATELTPVISNDKVKMAQLINNYKRQRGSTNLIEGVAKANNLFSTGRFDAKKILIIITDGEPNSDPHLQITELKSNGITVIGVGIGSDVDMNKISSWVSFGKEYYFENFDIFLKSLPSRLRSETEDHPHQLIITGNVNEPVAIGEDLTFDLQIVNIGSEDIPAGTVISFVGGEYFHKYNLRIKESIKSNDSYDTTIKLKATKKSFAHIPDDIEIVINHSQKGILIECDTPKIPLCSEYFIKSFINYELQIVPFINILLFGIIGSGKTSFLHSIYTALSSMLIDGLGTVGGNTDHVTCVYKRYPLSYLENFSETKICLWDSWGVDQENYKSEFLMQLLSGTIPDGYKMEEVHISGSIKDPEPLDQFDRRIHGVLLFLPVGILDSLDYTLRAQEILKKCSKMNLNPLIIVTQADLIASEDLPSHRKKIASALNIPEYRINLVRNYVEKNEKDFKIDKNTLRIFSEMVETAKQYIKSNVRQPAIDDGAQPNASPIVRSQSTPNATSRVFNPSTVVPPKPLEKKSTPLVLFCQLENQLNEEDFEEVYLNNLTLEGLKEAICEVYQFSKNNKVEYIKKLVGDKKISISSNESVQNLKPETTLIVKFTK